MVKIMQMKMNLIKAMTLLLAFNGFMNVIYPQIYRSTEIRSSYFGYINFKKTKITLSDTILKLSLKDIDTEKPFIQGMFFDAKLKLKDFSDSLTLGNSFFSTEIEWLDKEKIPETFVNLLCDNGMVSIAWDFRTKYMRPQFIKNEDTIIQNFKEWNAFWFLGKITINPNFDSYLILTKERDFSDIAPQRALFLMNIKDNIITSLIQVAYKQILEGEGPYFFTKASSRGRYCYYGIYHSTCFTINRFGKYINIPKEEKYIYYSFDDNGYVQVQELRGRNKFIENKYKYRFQENIE